MFVETLDGDLKKLRVNSIYKMKEIKKRGMIERVDMMYGANKKMSLIDGYHQYFDMEVLNILIKGNSVDTLHHHQDYLFDQEFTWDQSEYMRSKPREEVRNRIFQPTLAVFNKINSWVAMRRAKKQGTVMDLKNELGYLPLFTMFKQYDD